MLMKFDLIMCSRRSRIAINAMPLSLTLRSGKSRIWFREL